MFKWGLYIWMKCSMHGWWKWAKDKKAMILTIASQLILFNMPKSAFQAVLFRLQGVPYYNTLELMTLVFRAIAQVNTASERQQPALPRYLPLISAARQGWELQMQHVLMLPLSVCRGCMNDISSWLTEAEQEPAWCLGLGLLKLFTQNLPLHNMTVVLKVAQIQVLASSLAAGKGWPGIEDN